MSSRRPARSANRRRTTAASRPLACEPLETRRPLTVVSAEIFSVRGEQRLVITANNQPTTVEVSVTTDGAKLTVRDLTANRTWPVFSTTAFKAVEFRGGEAADVFTAVNCWIPLILDGRGGDDSLTGGGGNDTILGRRGRDILKGGSGDDYLNGGPGGDILTGGDGSDTVIAVDGYKSSTPTLDPTQQDVVRWSTYRSNDTVWIDATATTAHGTFNCDVVGTQYGKYTVGPGTGLVRVVSFANGADSTLNGDAIADPVMSNGTTTYASKNYATAPLFPTSVDPTWNRGDPTASNVVQGDLGNCALAAGMASPFFVHYSDSPWGPAALLVRRRVVDFADGTYGVQLGDSVYRVDADLPSGVNRPAFARGRSFDGTLCLWPSIIEKSFATRMGMNYANIKAISSIDVFTLLGMQAESVYEHTDGAAVLKQKLKNESLRGDYARSRGAITLELFNLIGAKKEGHAYSFVSFWGDDSVLLRNPWGRDGDLVNATDMPVNGVDNPNDGYIVVTYSELVNRRCQVMVGRTNNLLLS
jgi:hypothetical protein